MDKGLVDKDWQKNQPWHEDAKCHKQSFLEGLFSPTRNQVELEWGKSPPWGETPPSRTCFFGMGALPRHQQPWQTQFLALAHPWDLDYSCTAPSFTQEFQRFYTN